MNKLVLLISISLLAVTAQASEFGGVEDFYEANPDLVGGGSYAGRFVNPNYLLVVWARHNEMDSRLTSSGFVRLGESNWQRPNYINGYYCGGAPQKELAIGYAQIIGADIVIYSVSVTNDDQSEHWISFYAKQSVPRPTPASNGRRPTSAEATAAINRAQDAWHEPRVKGGVWYDPKTDTYNWIGPSGQARSKSASWFLDKFGAYLN